MAKYKLHPSIIENRILAACERRMITLDNPGFCLACGEEDYECDPDTRRKQCDNCGLRAVYGADEILMMSFYHRNVVPKTK